MGKANKKADLLFVNPLGRGEKTRTSGLYVPNVARYQLRHTPFLKGGAKIRFIFYMTLLF